MSLAKRPVLALALTLAAILPGSYFASPVHAGSTWVKKVKQELEQNSDPYDALVTRCILVRAMLGCDFKRAIELADQTIVQAEELDDPNAVAVANMLKSIALLESKGLVASNESYRRSCDLFDGECCPELRTLFWGSRARRDLSVGARQKNVSVYREIREAAKEATNPMVAAIAAMELTEFRTDRIAEREFEALREHIDAVDVPSMTWTCELKKLRNNYSKDRRPKHYMKRVVELAKLSEADGSLDNLAFATRFKMLLHRHFGEIRELEASSKKLTDVGRRLGSSSYITFGLTSQATAQLEQGNVLEAKVLADEALAHCPRVSLTGVRRLAHAAHVEICIEQGNKQDALKSLAVLNELGAMPGARKQRIDSDLLRSEIDRLLAENREANSVNVQLASEKQTAVASLSRLSKRGSLIALCFLAGFAAVLWRNHWRVTKINRKLRDVNTRLKDEMQVGEKNRTIREALEQRVARVERMESLGLLAGGIAHDFNNLLVGVVCNAQLLQRSELKSKVKHRCIDGILKSAETATDLSRKMLAYAGREPSARKNVDVVSLVKSLLPIFNSGPNLDVSVECDFQLDQAFASVDRTQFEQILLNLVSNARDASSESKRPVVVRVGRETVKDVAADSHLVGRRTEGDEFVFIEVQDRGVGMAEEEVAKIFEPFYGNKSTGRGMGLAVVYGLVNRQDGLIRCSSEPGVGTTMRVLLPESDAVGTIKDEVKEIPELAKQGTLVVIDDEASILDVISRAFEPADWNAETFLSGAEAITFIDKQRDSIDCILMDVVMPEIGGKAIVECLDQLGISVPIVMMSGFSNTNLNEFLTLPNVVLTMEKPFSVSELFEKVSRATFLAEDAVFRK